MGTGVAVGTRVGIGVGVGVGVGEICLLGGVFLNTRAEVVMGLLQPHTTKIAITTVFFCKRFQPNFSL